MQNSEKNIPRFTVSRITDIIKNTLEQTFPIVAIMGEISNLSITKKYAFFSLKDEDALIRCVIWNPKNIDITEGEQIVATGRITTYKQGSYYQFTVYNIEKHGEGLIAKEFMELKNKLQKEGLFDERHKKPLPKYIQSIALICGEDSAAYSDIIKILEDTIISHTSFFPVKVQGKDCAPSVIQAIKVAQKLPVQAVIIARGGGSAEDLHQFNNEDLAREVFFCTIPVVSAIGHEIDFTIIDFVSDIRAPTPTAAARLISPQKTEIITQMNSMHRIITERARFEATRILYKIDNNLRQITNILNERISQIRYEIIKYEKLFGKKIFIALVQKYTQRLLLLESKIESFNPKKVLQKGFALLGKKGKFESNTLNLPNEFDVVTKYGITVVKKKIE